MGYAYDSYLKNHRDNVMRGYDWLKEHIPEVLKHGSVLINYAHDDSKNSIYEYDAYDKYFYGRNRSYQVVQDFKMAWLHHIHNNPHHWQHWILINDEPDKGTVALPMEYHYIVEMICDWWAFSWQKENLYEIFNWYDDHKKNMILHDDTRKTVEDILSKIKTKLDEIEKEK